MCWSNVGADLTTTLNALSGLTRIVGGGLEAYGAMKGAAADQGAIEFNAQEYYNAAIISDRQARDAVKKGDYDVRTAKLASLALIATQRTAFAANRIKVNTGTAVDIQADVDTLFTMDAAVIRGNAQRMARGYTQRAYAFRRRGVMADVTAGDGDVRMAAVPSLLRTATGVADSWLRFGADDQPAGES